MERAERLESPLRQRGQQGDLDASLLEKQLGHTVAKLRVARRKCVKALLHIIDHNTGEPIERLKRIELLHTCDLRGFFSLLSRYTDGRDIIGKDEACLAEYDRLTYRIEVVQHMSRQRVGKLLGREEDSERETTKVQLELLTIQPAVQNDDSAEDNHSLSSEYGFRLFWDKTKLLPRFGAIQEYQIFDDYSRLKEEVMRKLSFHPNIMRAIASLCVHRKYLGDGKNAHPPYGYRYFTDISVTENFDPFELVNQGEEKTDAVLFSTAKATHPEDENGDPNDPAFIDYGLNTSEICNSIVRQAVNFLETHRRLDAFVGKFDFDPGNTQGKAPANEGNSVYESLRPFNDEPSHENLARALKSLWQQSEQIEDPLVDLDELMEQMCWVLEEMNVAIPRKHAGRYLARELRKLDRARRAVIDLFLRLKPGPKLLKHLSNLLPDPNTQKSVDELLQMQHRIIEPHLRNVCFVAKYFIRRNAPPETCVQTGVLGLSRAIDDFDHRTGLRFWRYCWKHIHEAILLALGEARYSSILPEKELHNIERVRSASHAAQSVYGDESIEKIAELAGMKIEDVEKILIMLRANQLLSYDTAVREDQRLIQDTTAAATLETPEDILIGREIALDINTLMQGAGLSSTQQETVLRHLTGGGEKTSREAPWALKKLRGYIHSKSLTAADFL